MRTPATLALLFLATGCGPAVDPAWTPQVTASEGACAAHAGVRQMTLLIHGLD